MFISNNVHTYEDFNQDLVYKVSQIRRIIDHVGFLELPYRIEHNASIDNSYRLKCWSEDSMICTDFVGGDSYVVGSLPDTTNYYALIYVAIAATGTPHLLTFDKAGNKVDVSPLT